MVNTTQSVKDTIPSRHRMHTQRTDSFDREREPATGRITAQRVENRWNINQANTEQYASNKDVPFSPIGGISRTNTYGNEEREETGPGPVYLSDGPLVRMDTDNGTLESHGQRPEQVKSIPSKAIYLLETSLRKIAHSPGIKWIADELLGVMKGLHEEATMPQFVLDDIVHFLRRHDSHSEPASLRTSQGFVDDCLRWSLLVKALDPNLTAMGPSYKAVADQISAVCMDVFPELAFAQFFDKVSDAELYIAGGGNGMSNFFRRTCPTGHHKDFAKLTPFHLAAKHGNHLLLKTMFQNAKLYYNKQVLQSEATPEQGATATDLHTDRSMDVRLGQLEVVVKADPAAQYGETAFFYAVHGACSPYETLQVLLAFTGTETPANDKGFTEAVEQGLDLAVEAYLDAGMQLESKAFVSCLRRALGKLGDDIVGWAKGRSVCSERDCRLNIVKSFVRRADVPEKFTKEIVQQIIENDLVEVWDLKCEDVPLQRVKDSLLHLAILHQKDNFVERFVDAYPSSLTIPCKVPYNGSHEKMYPLWYNNHTYTPDEDEVVFSPYEEHSTVRTRIRDIVVTKMIHLLDLENLTDILHRSNGMLTCT